MVVYIYRMNVKDKYYIGSTKNIKYRIYYHKSDCYNSNSDKYNIKVYKYIRENCADWSEVSFQILDVYDDISKDFKKDIEQYYIEYFSNNLNSIPAKTKNERNSAISKYFQINKLNERVQCECGRFVTRRNLKGHLKRKIHQELLNK